MDRLLFHCCKYLCAGAGTLQLSVLDLKVVSCFSTETRSSATSKPLVAGKPQGSSCAQLLLIFETLLTLTNEYELCIIVGSDREDKERVVKIGVLFLGIFSDSLITSVIFETSLAYMLFEYSAHPFQMYPFMNQTILLASLDRHWLVIIIHCLSMHT